MHSKWIISLSVCVILALSFHYGTCDDKENGIKIEWQRDDNKKEDSKENLQEGKNPHEGKDSHESHRDESHREESHRMESQRWPNRRPHYSDPNNFGIEGSYANNVEYEIESSSMKNSSVQKQISQGVQAVSSDLNKRISSFQKYLVTSENNLATMLLHANDLINTPREKLRNAIFKRLVMAIQSYEENNNIIAENMVKMVQRMRAFRRKSVECLEHYHIDAIKDTSTRVIKCINFNNEEIVHTMLWATNNTRDMINVMKDASHDVGKCHDVKCVGALMCGVMREMANLSLRSGMTNVLLAFHVVNAVPSIPECSVGVSAINVPRVMLKRNYDVARCIMSK